MRKAEEYKVESSEETRQVVRGGLDAILTAEQVADWLQVSPRQVVRMGIPYFLLGAKTRRYRLGDVIRWLEGVRGRPVPGWAA